MSIFWQRGQMAEFARKLQVNQSYLSDVLHRRKRVSAKRAKRMAEISAEILGYPIPWEVFLFNKTSAHPAIFGMPIYD